MPKFSIKGQFNIEHDNHLRQNGDASIDIKHKGVERNSQKT